MNALLAARNAHIYTNLLPLRLIRGLDHTALRNPHAVWEINPENLRNIESKPVQQPRDNICRLV